MRECPQAGTSCSNGAVRLKQTSVRLVCRNAGHRPATRVFRAAVHSDVSERLLSALYGDALGRRRGCFATEPMIFRGS